MTETVPEGDELSLLDRIEELGHEPVARGVVDPHRWMHFYRMSTDCLQQMRLAKSNTTMDEERGCGVRAGFFATAIEAAWASWLSGPTTKLSNVWF